MSSFLNLFPIRSTHYSEYVINENSSHNLSVYYFFKNGRHSHLVEFESKVRINSYILSSIFT